MLELQRGWNHLDSPYLLYSRGGLPDFPRFISLEAVDIQRHSEVHHEFSISSDLEDRY